MAIDNVMKHEAKTRLEVIAISFLFSFPLLSAGPLDNWAIRTSGSSANLGDSIYSNGMFVVVGAGGTILTSTNGTNWSAQNSMTANRLLNVAFGSGIYIAAGGGSEDTLQTSVVSSPDGVNWTLRSVPQAGRVRCLTYGAGKFVGWCYTEFHGPPICTVLSSANGVTWTQHGSITNHFLTGITYANGGFVAVGQDYTGGPENGAIFSSPDGIIWTKRTGGFSNELSDVTYGNGMFLAVGWSGAVHTSVDGLDWTSRTVAVPADLFHVIFGNGTFVAVGDETVSDNGLLATSANGMDWIATTFSGITIRTVSYGYSSYVIAGFDGFIAQSGSFRPAILTPVIYSVENGFQVNLRGEIGRLYQLQATTNLAIANWSLVTSVTLGQSETNIFDETATNFARRYYRAVSP